MSFAFEIRQADSGVTALKTIDEFQPDIVLLDIQMPGMTGMEVIRQFEILPFQVIFQTAFDEFAVQAFEQQACDYLLKPFTGERLQKSLNKALHNISSVQKLDDLEQKFRVRDGYLTKLQIRQGKSIKILNVEEIQCFVSQDHYTCVYTDSGEFISDLSLSHLEKQLDPKRFFRNHRKAIVNVGCVKEIIRGENMKIITQGGMQVPVSRSQRQKVPLVCSCIVN